MISFHFILSRFQAQTPKVVTISTRHILHLLLFHTQINTCSEYPPLTVPLNSDRNSLQAIAIHLSNCTNSQQLNQLHAQIIKSRVLQLNPTSFLWNNIVRSYVRLDKPNDALDIYISMSKSSVYPDLYTIPIVLKAVVQSFAFEIGRQVHCIAFKHGIESYEFCESGFIGLYCKMGEFDNARNVFDQSAERKLGSWNAIIGGLAHGGQAREAINMFVELLRYGLEPDDVTMVSVTSACGGLGDLNLALQLHKCVFQAKKFEKSDMLMLNSLIDMYGKCGRMDLAYEVFAKTVQRNVSTWTSLIMGYAMHGHAKQALECFYRMREAGVVPNHVTFVGVLSACVHGGMLEEGRQYFDMMKNTYGIKPMLPHYGLMVDLLGRAGLLKKAKEMVERMPIEPNVVIWGTLMGACEKHGSVEMGECVAKHLEELEPWNDGVYVVLSNIYARAGLWDKVERVRVIMKGRKIAKTPGYSLATA